MVLGIVTLALFYQACNLLVMKSVTGNTSPVLQITVHYPVCRGSYSFHLMCAYSTFTCHGTEQNAAVRFFVSFINTNIGGALETNCEASL